MNLVATMFASQPVRKATRAANTLRSDQYLLVEGSGSVLGRGNGHTDLLCKKQNSHATCSCSTVFPYKFVSSDKTIIFTVFLF